jgi:glycosyltransferase involved in cell wall biosynthesis
VYISYKRTIKRDEIMKIAYFHWCFDQIGGGEVLARDIGKALDIPVHSIVGKENPFDFIDISNDLPFITNQFRRVRTMDYLAWSTVDVTKFGDFDIILSSGGTTRALVVPDHIPHVNLCLSTSRWLYDLYHYRLNKMGVLKSAIIPFAELMRLWDASVDNRVDYYISISPIIKRRLYKYLKRESDIIYTPINMHDYDNYVGWNEYYLFMSRLEPEKRPEEAIKACIEAKETLIVAGTGSMEKMLREKYKNYKNIQFQGFINDAQKTHYLATCKALIYPAVAEDFGIVPIEALASGKPVICSNDGFPPTLIKNKYGYITEGTSESILKAIKSMQEFNPQDLINCAKQFDFSIFKKNINERMNFYYEDFNSKFNK